MKAYIAYYRPVHSSHEAHCVCSTFTSRRNAEEAFRKMLHDLYLEGRINYSVYLYFSRSLQERLSLALSLKIIEKLVPPLVILDLGCGMGALEVKLHGLKKLEIVGLDIERQYVQWALQRAKFHGMKKPLLVVGDIRALPLRRCLFDVVILHDVVFAINLYEVIEEVTEVIKRGGRLIFDAPMKFFYQMFPIPRPFIKYYTKEILSALEKKGMVVEEIFLSPVRSALQERYPLPRPIRMLSRIMMVLPKAFQKRLSNFWFLVFFVAKSDTTRDPECTRVKEK